MNEYYLSTKIRKDCQCGRCTQIRLMASFGENSLRRLFAGEFRILARAEWCSCPDCLKLDEKE